MNINGNVERIGFNAQQVKKMNVLNSQTFEITSTNSDAITICDGGEYIKVKVCDFHKFFYLGFCITVHASQGETYSKRYTIHDWRHPRFCDKPRGKT